MPLLFVKHGVVVIVTPLKLLRKQFIDVLAGNVISGGRWCSGLPLPSGRMRDCKVASSTPSVDYMLTPRGFLLPPLASATLVYYWKSPAFRRLCLFAGSKPLDHEHTINYRQPLQP
jgi:hypothetical protein